MNQELDKAINHIEGATKSFLSIQWPSVSAETNIDSLVDQLSEITGVVMDCHYAVQEAGSSTRSTGWYVDEELLGAVQSDSWHATADLAESLESRLDQIRDQAWQAHEKVAQLDDTSVGWMQTADQAVARIEKSASINELAVALRTLPFLIY